MKTVFMSYIIIILNTRYKTYLEISFIYVLIICENVVDVECSADLLRLLKHVVYSILSGAPIIIRTLGTLVHKLALCGYSV